APVEVTDSKALEEFSPWDDRFMDLSRGFVANAPDGETYQVTIEVKPRWLYSFDYIRGPAGGPGYIYLPGPGDSRHEKNTFTIIRGEDGRWVYASQDWDALMARVLKQYAVSSVSKAPSLLPETGGMGNLFLAWAALGASLVTIGAVLLYAVRKADQPVE
ncbi:MAG: LPXTG cell wall anchor domain-containing protein, partial [Rudaea sp.]